MTLTVSSVVSEWGNYYIDAGQNASRIYKLIHQNQETASLFRTIITKDTLYRVTLADIGDVLQAFQEAFTHKGDWSFEPNDIPLYNVKADNMFLPDKIKNSWFGFWEDLEKPERHKWNIVRWFLEVLKMPKLHENMETCSFYGEYVAPTPGTAGTVLGAFTGIRKVQDDYVASGRITPIISGAPSTDPLTFCNQIEAWVKLIPEKYRYRPMKLVMSKELRDRYAQGRMEKYQKGVIDNPNPVYTIFGSSIVVVGVASMAGSNGWWCTPEGNAVKLQRRPKDIDFPKPYSQDRFVKMMLDFWVALNYLVPEIVFINDQN
jgi:hypothetical protein